MLPGFRSGMVNVALDEQRHIGFGVKLLSDLCREDPDCRHAVADMLREVIPFTAAVPGRVESPTVTIECRYEDWTDLLGGREHPLKLAATRRLRSKGDLRWLWSARRMFPA